MVIHLHLINLGYRMFGFRKAKKNSMDWTNNFIKQKNIIKDLIFDFIILLKNVQKTKKKCIDVVE